MRRGQASITAIEAGVGVLLVMSLVFAFAVGDPGEQSPAVQSQLDAYADDTATLLSTEQPRHDHQTRLTEVTASGDAFERESDALEARIEEILPANVFFRVETPYGAVGHSLPADIPTGTATVPTRNGDVTVRVWYS